MHRSKSPIPKTSKYHMQITHASTARRIYTYPLKRNNGSVDTSNTDFGLHADQEWHCCFCRTQFRNNKEFRSCIPNTKFKL